MAFLENLALRDAARPDLDAVASLRELYGQDGNAKGYLAFAGRVADRYPQNPDALQVYALALSGDKQWEQAAAVYRRMIVINNKNAGAHAGLGAVLEAQNKKNEAVAAYRAAKIADPGNAAAADGLKRLGAEPVKTGAAGPAPAPGGSGAR